MAHFTQNNNLLLLSISYKHVTAITVIPYNGAKLNKNYTKVVNNYLAITQLLLQLNKLKHVCKQAKSRQSLAGPEACAVILTSTKCVACYKDGNQVIPNF